MTSAGLFFNGLTWVYGRGVPTQSQIYLCVCVLNLVPVSGPYSKSGSDDIFQR